MRIACFFILLIPFLGSSLHAQPGSVTEKEVQLRGLFIEANQQKLLGNYEKAAEKYLSLLDKVPENGAIAYELARIYEAMDENAKAIEYARKAWSWEKNTWYAVLLAELQDKMDKPEQAAELFQELLKQEPDNDYYYQKLGYFLVASGQTEKAIKVYDELEERVGIIEDLIRKKYNLYLGLGKEKKAEDELLKLIEYYPNNTEYYHQLAYFYRQNGDKQKAREVYETILQIDPDNNKARLALASADSQKNNDDRFAQIRPLFNDPAVSLDEKIKTILPLVESLPQSEDTQLAIQLSELATQLTEQYPENAKSHALLADLYLYSNKREEAIQQYEQALSLRGNVFSVWEQLLYLYLESGQYRKMSQKAEEGMDYFPNQPELYYLNGLANYRLGSFTDAMPLLDQAEFMSVQSPELLLKIKVLKGEVLNRQDKHQQADKQFQEAINSAPENPLPKITYAYQLALRTEAEDTEKAAALLEEVPVSLAGKLPLLDQAKACIQYSKENYPEAKVLFEKVLEKVDSPSPELLEQYGNCLFQLGEADKAVMYWKEAQDMGYQSPTLSRKIADKKLYD
jgi:tetratricopeptide (TPR) repeat protein